MVDDQTLISAPQMDWIAATSLVSPGACDLRVALSDAQMKMIIDAILDRLSEPVAMLARLSELLKTNQLFYQTPSSAYNWSTPNTATNAPGPLDHP